MQGNLLSQLLALRARCFSRKLTQPFQPPTAAGTSRRAAVGRYGEDAAAEWLVLQHCRILARNFRPPQGGEVDIVARQRSLLLFVEVKTRHASTRIRPFEAVDAKKRSLIERGANAWLRRLGTRELPWRFDVIEVYYDEARPPVIHHIRNAF